MLLFVVLFHFLSLIFWRCTIQPHFSRCMCECVCVWFFCSLYIYWPDFCLYFPNRFRDFRRVPGVFIIFARTHNKCIYRKSLKHTFRNQGAWTKTNAHQPRGNFYDHFILSRKKSYWFWFAYCNVSMKHIARKTPTTTATIATTTTTAMTTKAETTSNEQKSQASKHCKLRYICFYSPIESTLDLFVLYCNWDFFLSLSFLAISRGSIHTEQACWLYFFVLYIICSRFI